MTGGPSVPPHPTPTPLKHCCLLSPRLSANQSCRPDLGPQSESNHRVPEPRLPPCWRIEPGPSGAGGAWGWGRDRGGGAVARQRAVCWRGGAGPESAVTQSGVMRAGEAPGSLAGGPARAGPGGWRGPAAGAPQPPHVGAQGRLGNGRSKPGLPDSVRIPAQPLTLRCDSHAGCLRVLTSKMEATLQDAVTRYWCTRQLGSLPLYTGMTLVCPSTSTGFILLLVSLGKLHNLTHLQFPHLLKEVARMPCFSCGLGIP